MSGINKLKLTPIGKAGSGGSLFKSFPLLEWHEYVSRMRSYSEYKDTTEVDLLNLLGEHRGDSVLFTTYNILGMENVRIRMPLMFNGIGFYFKQEDEEAIMYYFDGDQKIFSFDGLVGDITVYKRHGEKKKVYIELKDKGIYAFNIVDKQFVFTHMVG